MVEAQSAQTDCYFCGKEFGAASHQKLNIQLFEHAIDTHPEEMRAERQRRDGLDPIAVTDLIREGPDA